MSKQKGIIKTNYKGKISGKEDGKIEVKGKGKTLLKKISEKFNGTILKNTIFVEKLNSIKDIEISEENSKTIGIREDEIYKLGLAALTTDLEKIDSFEKSNKFEKVHNTIYIINTKNEINRKRKNTIFIENRFILEILTKIFYSELFLKFLTIINLLIHMIKSDEFSLNEFQYTNLALIIIKNNNKNIFSLLEYSRSNYFNKLSFILSETSMTVKSNYIIHMKINEIKPNNHLIQSLKTTFRENSHISINILLIVQNSIIQLLNLVYITVFFFLT